MRNYASSLLRDKFKQIFKIGSISNIIPDGSNYPKTQIQTIGGKVQNSVVIQSYGFHSVAPVGGQAYAFAINGDEGNSAVIADAPDLRPKGLKVNETVIGNWTDDNTIYFKEDGSIVINASKNDINITTTGTFKVNINGCEFLPNGVARIPVLEVGTMTGISGGAITSDVDIQANGISLKTHIHGGVTTGAGNTGVPQ